MDTSYVIATLYPPRRWAEYDTYDEAKAVLPEVRESYPSRGYRVMDAHHFAEEERRFYLAQPMAPVSAAEFEEMRGESLAHHEILGHFERFTLDEIQGPGLASHYARLEGRCYAKLADPLDSSTWITAEDISWRECSNLPTA
jgi:hypothetical protein